MKVYYKTSFNNAYFPINYNHLVVFEKYHHVLLTSFPECILYYRGQTTVELSVYCFTNIGCTKL